MSITINPAIVDDMIQSARGVAFCSPERALRANRDGRIAALMDMLSWNNPNREALMLKMGETLLSYREATRQWAEMG